LSIVLKIILFIQGVKLISLEKVPSVFKETFCEFIVKISLFRSFTFPETIIVPEENLSLFSILISSKTGFVVSKIILPVNIFVFSFSSVIFTEIFFIQSPLFKFISSVS